MIVDWFLLLYEYPVYIKFLAPLSGIDYCMHAPRTSNCVWGSLGDYKFKIQLLIDFYYCMHTPHTSITYLFLFSIILTSISQTLIVSSIGTQVISIITTMQISHKQLSWKIGNMHHIIFTSCFLFINITYAMYGVRTKNGYIQSIIRD